MLQRGVEHLWPNGEGGQVFYTRARGEGGQLHIRERYGVWNSMGQIKRGETRKEERIQSDFKGSLLWVCHWALREEAAEPSAEVGCSGSADVYGEGRTNGPYARLNRFLSFLSSGWKHLMFLARKSKRKTDSKPGVKQKKITKEWYTAPLAMHRALRPSSTIAAIPACC